MRIALVIVALAAISVGMVHLRRAQTRAAHEVHRLQLEQIRLRRRLYDQQAILGRLTAPRCVLKRADEMDTALANELDDDDVVADGHGAVPAGGRRTGRGE